MGEGFIHVWKYSSPFQVVPLPREVGGHWKHHAVAKPDLERARRDEPASRFYSDAKAATISAALAECSFTNRTTRP
jgi:hypothetical protein